MNTPTFCTLGLLGLTLCTPLAEAAPQPTPAKQTALPKAASNLAPALRAWDKTAQVWRTQLAPLNEMEAFRLIIDKQMMGSLTASDAFKKLSKQCDSFLKRYAEADDEAKLSASDRRLLAVLREHGIKVGRMNGVGFLQVDATAFISLPQLSKEAEAFASVLAKEPCPIFYEDSDFPICEPWDMTDCILRWEAFIREGAAGPYAELAHERFSFFLELLYWSPATFPEPGTDPIDADWCEAFLKSPADENPGTELSRLTNNYLDLLKANDGKISNVIRLTMRADIRVSLENMKAN